MLARNFAVLYVILLILDTNGTLFLWTLGNPLNFGTASDVGYAL